MVFHRILDLKRAAISIIAPFFVVIFLQFDIFPLQLLNFY